MKKGVIIGLIAIVGISFLDVSTGEFLIAEGSKEYVEKLIQGFEPTQRETEIDALSYFPPFFLPVHEPHIYPCFSFVPINWFPLPPPS